MPQVLTTKAQITCPHGGLGTSTPSEPIWSVNGGFVLVDGDSGVLTCPFAPAPCGGYTLRSMGLNASQVSGKGVILATDFNQTNTGLLLVMTESHTTLDDSTPAPLPLGQDAPPLPPELTDMTPPVVIATPPGGGFSINSGTPGVWVVIFTLSSAHPLKWILTLINEPLAKNFDVTNGDPLGLVVAPAGGAWNTPALTVSVTLTAPYMAGLGPGMYHFYLTAVSKRGLSAYAKFDLAVGP